MAETNRTKDVVLESRTWTPVRLGLRLEICELGLSLATYRLGLELRLDTSGLALENPDSPSEILNHLVLEGALDPSRLNVVFQTCVVFLVLCNMN